MSDDAFVDVEASELGAGGWRPHRCDLFECCGVGAVLFCVVDCFVQVELFGVDDEVTVVCRVVTPRSTAT